MHSTGLVHSGKSWWGEYAVVLRTSIPCSCCKYLAYEHFHEHCKGMVSEDVVCARPLWWHCPGAAQQLLQSVSPWWWGISAVSCSKCSKGHFWTEHTTLYVAFLAWKPCGKAVRVLLLADSSTLRVDIPVCRGLGVLIDQFCNLCACVLCLLFARAVSNTPNASFVLRWVVMFKAQMENSESFLSVWSCTMKILLLTNIEDRLAFLIFSLPKADY